MTKCNYRILFFNGAPIVKEYAQFFAPSPLHDLDNVAAKVLSKYRNERPQSPSDAGRISRFINGIVEPVKIKLFNIIFRRLFLPSKAPKSGNFVCLYVAPNIQLPAFEGYYRAR